MHKKAQAFTLIELMIVISIMVLLAGMSVPMLSIVARGKRLENAGRAIQSGLNEARRLSITKRRHHKVVFAASALKIYDTVEKRYVGEKMRLDSRIAYKLGFRSYTPPYQDSAEDDLNPSADAINNYSLEFRNDGSLIFDPYTSISRTLFDIEGNNEADLVITLAGERKRCYVDIDPASGRATFKMETPKGAN